MLTSVDCGLVTAAMKTKTGIAGDNTILMPPGPIADLPKYFTSTLGTTAIVGNFSMLAWGLRTGMTIARMMAASRRGGVPGRWCCRPDVVLHGRLSVSSAPAAGTTMG